MSLLDEIDAELCEAEGRRRWPHACGLRLACFDVQPPGHLRPGCPLIHGKAWNGILVGDRGSSPASSLVRETSQLLALRVLRIPQGQLYMFRARPHRRLPCTSPSPAQRPTEPDRLQPLPICPRHHGWRSHWLDRRPVRNRGWLICRRSAGSQAGSPDRSPSKRLRRV
jgi:hypothetical protein